MTGKLCSDCRHYRYARVTMAERFARDWIEHRCEVFKTFVAVNEPVIEDCHDMRRAGGVCGPMAEMFEAKPRDDYATDSRGMRL